MRYLAPEIKNLTNYYPKAVFDYLCKTRTIRSFYKHYPSLEGYGEKIIHRTFTPDKRKNLVEILKSQYGDLLQQKGSDKVSANIESLANENCYTVTTGQQIHIYLGPLYVTYKILSTIAKCQWLSKNFKGYNFVPVFWMATEDHDFEEISSIKLYNREFKWPQQQGYTGAVGRLNPLSINELEKEIAPLVQNDEQAKKLLELFTHAYSNFPTLASATRYAIHMLFKQFGLIVIDGDDKRFKESFKNYIKDDIFKEKNTQVINLTTAKFEKYYKAQIHPREINFFYLTENGRYRLVKEGEKYKALGSDFEFDTVQLTYEIDAHPEKFSPNVVMRPLYQESILPNIAYIGGPGEINYWLQLRDFFRLNGMQFPILELRKSVILLNEKTASKIESMGFTALDFIDEARELENSFVEKNAESGPDFTSHYKKITAELEAIKTKALEADASLKPFLEGELIRISQLFEKLDGKLEKTGKKQFETQLQQIATIKEKFFAPGALTERSETLLSNSQLAQSAVVKNLIATFNQTTHPLIILLPPLI